MLAHVALVCRTKRVDTSECSHIIHVNNIDSSLKLIYMFHFCSVKIVVYYGGSRAADCGPVACVGEDLAPGQPGRSTHPLLQTVTLQHRDTQILHTACRSVSML